MTTDRQVLIWRDNWMFKRAEDGSVAIRKRISIGAGAGGFDVEAFVDADEWPSIVHHLAFQRTPEAFAVLRGLHDGTLTRDQLAALAATIPVEGGSHEGTREGPHEEDGRQAHEDEVLTPPASQAEKD